MMCGRASQSVRSTNLAAQSFGAQLSSDKGIISKNDPSQEANQHLNLSINMDNLTNDKNTSPGTKAHVFQNDRSGNCMQCMPSTWGFSQIKSIKRLFNARSETIDTKPTFQHLLLNRQSCVWAVDGYYEWREKQPYFVNRIDEMPMLLAGLWREENDGNKTFAILTMEAYSSMEWLHPRQPVILPDSAVAMKWLSDPTADLVIDMCSSPEHKSSINDQLHFYPVTKRMSDGKYHGEDCTKEVKLSSIKSFFGGAPNRESENTINSANENTRKDAATHTTQQPEKKIIADTLRSPKGQNFNPQHAPLCNEQHEKECVSDMQQEKTESVLMTPQSKIQNSEAQNSSFQVINEGWTCQTCTFRHTGNSINFLSCEMCGTERSNMIGDELKLGTDALPEERSYVKSRAWGSLRSPSKSSKKPKL